MYDYRSLALSFYDAALAATDGRRLTSARLQNTPGRWTVLAVGKAAPAMVRGASDALGDRLTGGLTITTTDRVADCVVAGVRVLAGSHPVPDASSLDAGAAAYRLVADDSDRTGLLVLLSGGASALMDVPREDLSLVDLIALNRWLLASGLDIGVMNELRRRASRLKGGGLARLVGRRPCLQLVISDVLSGAIGDIGSGPFVASRPVTVDHIQMPDAIRRLVGSARGDTEAPTDIETEVLACNADAVAAVTAAAKKTGVTLTTDNAALTGDAVLAGHLLGQRLRHSTGFVSGGETTVVLPANPGNGGRCQALALAAATEIENSEAWLLAAGTDGRDGPSDVAGALVDGGTIARGRGRGLDPASSLDSADSGGFLAASGDTLAARATGTNVADIVIGLTKPGSGRVA